jgi:hypothetical protein
VAEMVQRWEVGPAADDQDIRHDLAMGPKHGVRLPIRARRVEKHAEGQSQPERVAVLV